MTTSIEHTTTRPATDRLRADERRYDGRIKVVGEAQYTADFTMPGMLWAAFVASTMAHARIVSIDTRAAKEMPGVHAVLTGADIGERYFGRRLCDWPVLSVDRVRFIGEYVVAVAADTPEIAAAAAATIEIEYEELPTLFDTEAALEPDALVLHEHPEKYPFMFPKRPQHAHKNIQGQVVSTLGGDVDEALAAADRVFSYTFTTPRYHGGYIEPRATLVWLDADGTVHVISTNKGPFGLREQLATTTGIPKEKIVIHPSYIGGDFGAKGLSVEEFPCFYLAQATGRPVKFVRAYVDDIRSTNVRHASKVTVRIGVSNAGKFSALDVRALFDGGAYAAGKVIPTIVPGPETKSPYGIPNQRFDRLAVYTNTVPGGFVRAPGEFQITFAMESAVDLIARELGIDPLELRLLNAARAGDVDIEHHPFLEPRAVEVLEALKRESNWGAPREPGRGIGVALGVRHIGGGKTSLVLRPCADGSIDILSGTTEVGMGILTVIQRVVAVELDIDESLVRATRLGTDAVPFDPGIGASRTTHIVGQAARNAVALLRADLDALAAARAAAGEAALGWSEAMAALVAAKGVEHTYTGTHDGDHAHGTPDYNNFAGFVIDVTVDEPTGTVTINEVVHVVDVGTVINPIAHRGQIDGGFLMGLGHAVTEELVVEDGRITNLSFADYKMPTQKDMPPLRVVLLEANTGPGPFGARAIGEVNTSIVGPALANAVHAAVGIRIPTLPITAERVYEALHRSTT
jgi:CO/xanthine dehydrogenase Mo-binding subunit